MILSFINYLSTNHPTMEAVIQELKQQTIYWICYQLDGSYIDNGSYWNMHHYVKDNKDKIDDDLTESPYWLYSMECRNRYTWLNFDDLNVKVRCDYKTALSQHRGILGSDSIQMTKEEIKATIYGLRNMMWREAQREKLTMLYGKVPTDVLNEMLMYM